MPLLLLFKQQTLCCLMRWVLGWGVFPFQPQSHVRLCGCVYRFAPTFFFVNMIYVGTKYNMLYSAFFICFAPLFFQVFFIWLII